jgi:hypothetical protein
MKGVQNLNAILLVKVLGGGAYTGKEEQREDCLPSLQDPGERVCESTVCFQWECG